MARTGELTMQPRDPLISYTLFPDVWPREKIERSDVSWSELVGRIANAATYIDKKHCPLISMAEYGDELSSSGCIRHALNVKRIFGIELDYDGEQMPLAIAAAKLKAANVQAVLYTSPSHKPSAPRWRALFPLADPALPEERGVLVARANRILGGVASRESFTLSQSFYIGRVRGADYETAETQGRCIDEALDVEPLFYVGQGGAGETRKDLTTDGELRAAFERGEDRYQAMLKLSARWAARGLAEDDIAAALDALFGNGSSINGDGIDLRQRIPAMARSAVAKFGETRRSYYEPDDAPPPDEPPPWMEGQRVNEYTPPPDAEAAPTDSDRKITATVFQWVDPKTIPPRPWLYARHYMRGMVSSTAGIGGAGKSSILIVEALSIATGRDLFHNGAEIPVGPQRVWLHNGEDPLDELQRRFGAAMQHYGITQADLGDRLRVTSGRDVPIMVAAALSDGGKMLAPTGDGELLAEEIQRENIVAFIADPFVTLHRVSENDNVLIDGVMTIIRNLAHRTGCAFELAHHFRKLNGQEASVDDVRGASSIIGACRSVRIVAQMTKDEGEKYGLPEDERRSYIWLQNGKANMLPPTHARRWMQMTSVDLGNAVAPLESDKVGVPVTWEPPDARYDLTSPQFRAIRQAITSAPQPLNTLRYDVRAAGWVGKLIAASLELDITDGAVRNSVRGLIERWVKSGRLAVDEMRDPKQARAALVVRWVDDEEA
jgi:hypothetical protein